MTRTFTAREFRKLLKTAFTAIFKNRFRSFLTALGIILGVSAVIIISALGKGSQIQIEKEISDLGTNLLIIVPGGSHAGGISRGAGTYNRFTMKDIDYIREESHEVSLITPVVQSGGQVIATSANWNCEVIGADVSFFKIKNWGIEYGNYFTKDDIKQNRKVLLLGATVSSKLFPDEDPTGKTVRIRNIPFKVLGLLEKKGQSSLGKDQDDLIVAPWSTVLHRLKGGRFIDMIYASVSSQEKLSIAQNEIKNIIRVSHNIAATENDDFEIHSQTEITETITHTTRIFTLLLSAIACISLIVGGIGIMNIMLVSIVERTKEIGIRLSVGARASDIWLQFILESMMLSLCGGLMGICLAFLIIFFLSLTSSFLLIITPGIILLAFFFSAFIGIFFGFYPALKASRLNPIESLRYE